MKRLLCRKCILIPLLLALAVLACCALWQGLAVRQYRFQSGKVANPVRLAVLSDLHETFYGSSQDRLLEKLEDENPDVVLLSGDILETSQDAAACALLSQIGKRWPCYYVTGNHEVRSGELDAIVKKVESYSVQVLRGRAETVSVGNTRLSICGVDDVSVGESVWKEQLKNASEQAKPGALRILLSHRPERVEDYADGEFDWIFSGHAHGGQVRLPGLVNGLYAPNQGFFPRYAGGVYPLENGTLVVSRGLVRNWLPRVFNPPELVIVDILPEK